MSDILSQDEIDALLNTDAMDDDSDDEQPEEETAQEQPESQEQPQPQAAAPAPTQPQPTSVPFPEDDGDDYSYTQELSEEELKSLSDVADISLGATSSVIQMMINQDVSLSFKELTVINARYLSDKAGTNEIIAARIGYTEGFEGQSYLVLPKNVGTMISDMMMGGSGDSNELGDMQLSALGELMNQMMGRMTTSLSEIFKRKIDITTPEISSHNISIGETISLEFAAEKHYVSMEFSIEIADKGNYKLLFLMPLNFARIMAKELVNPKPSEKKPAPPPPPNSLFGLPDGPLPGFPGMDQGSQPAASPIPPQMPPQMPGVPNMNYQNPMGGMNMQNQNGGMQQMPNGNNNGFPGQNPQGMMPGIGLPGVQMPQISPAEFGMLQMPNGLGLQSNIDLLLDVPLQITVELGRTQMLIKDVLELGIGSVVELNKLAGESVEVFVNNKLIAKGEVVVIDESFAVKITNIISPQDRLQTT